VEFTFGLDRINGISITKSEDVTCFSTAVAAATEIALRRWSTAFERVRYVSWPSGLFSVSKSDNFSCIIITIIIFVVIIIVVVMVAVVVVCFMLLSKRPKILKSFRMRFKLSRLKR